MRGIKNENKSTLGASFTPDSSHMLLGSEDAHIHIRAAPKSSVRVELMIVGGNEALSEARRMLTMRTWSS